MTYAHGAHMSSHTLMVLTSERKGNERKRHHLALHTLFLCMQALTARKREEGLRQSGDLNSQVGDLNSQVLALTHHVTG
jgi:hypothetical protein